MRGPLALIVITAFVAAAAFVAEHPGRVEITWQGWQVETSVGVLAAAFLLVGGVVVGVGAMISRVFGWPRRIGRHRRERRRRAAYAALTRGLAAIAAGDAKEAHSAAHRAAALVDELPLALLLTAQAAQLNGDEAASKQALTAMLERPETALLGLRGLVADALRAGDPGTALSLAEQAHGLRPDLPWAIETVLALRLRAARWEAAQQSLADAARHHIVPPERARHHRGVILVELSRAAERRGELRHAASLAARAEALAPDLAAPVCRHASCLVALGRTRAAGRLVARAWRSLPHPDLARVWHAIHQGEALLARVGSAQRLAAANPDATESRLIVAEAALDARLWGEARRHLADEFERATPGGPSRRLCLLMARLEEGEYGDPGRGREWLGRAVGAPPDPRYFCARCGGESPDWHALCPACGNFDTLAWAQAAPAPVALAALGPLLPAPSGLAPAAQ